MFGVSASTCRPLRAQSPHGSTTPAAYNIRSGDAMSSADTPFEDVLKERFGSIGGVGVRA